MNLKAKISLASLVLCYNMVTVLYAPAPISTPATLPGVAVSDSDEDSPSTSDLLLDAAKTNNSAHVQRLLASDPCIWLEIPDHTTGMTPLMYAAKRGSVGMIDDLLAAGAKVDTTNKTDREFHENRTIINMHTWTALMYAAHYGHVGSVRQLLAAGADSNAVNKKKQTALMLAIASGKTAAALELISRNLVLEHRDNNGRTALFLAVSFGNITVLNKLLMIGANPNANDGALTALMSAAADGDYDVTKILLDAGADPNKVIRGKTALSLASEEGYDNITTLLTTYGATTP